MDAFGAFTHVDASWPGSVHDARVFRNSVIMDGIKYKHILQGTTQNIEGVNLPEMILAD